MFRTVRVWALIKWLARIAVILALASTVLLFVIVHLPGSTIPEIESSSKTIILGQGWSDDPASDHRQLYYYTPQGATIPPGSTTTALRYDWLVNLEKAWGQERFAEPQHMRALGFIVDEQPSGANPDHLPVGFSKHWNQDLGEALLDINCATCHTGQLNVQKDGERLAVRIDGGSATHAIMDLSLHQFAPALIGAMVSTYFNPFKFNRFAQKVLKDNYENGKGKLRENFWGTLVALATQKQVNPLRGLYPVEEGYGRVDAIGRIANTVFGAHLDIDNFDVGDAPVSYPPVWNAWKFDWVQYSGSVKQPMARNMGEALGVGARINLVDPYGRPLPPEQRFTSSILVENLHSIETTLQQLNQPKWDEELFGVIDWERAARGKNLFKKHCVSCHGPHKVAAKVKHAEAPLKGDKDPEWHVKLIDIEQVGTDSTAADNFVDNRYDLGKTGMTNNEAGALLKPYLVRALRNQVIAEFHSPFLHRFLDGENPESSSLIRDTSWMNDKPWNLSGFEEMFNDWHKTGAGELEDELASKVGNDEQVELIRMEIVRIALEKIEQRIAGIDVSSVSVGEGLNLLGFLLREKYYADNEYTPAKQACLDGFGIMDLPQVKRAYKSRPLGGIWATPPFLHNGSVISIYQLLSPLEERVSEFYVGQNLFDPETVGFKLSEDLDGGILFDTTVKGNSNIGHQFREGYIPYQEGVKPVKGIIGPALHHNERMEIIEYLKIHQDPPTPAGRVIQDCAGL
jgi:mono/diheme cytochrome c family protein